MRRSRGASVKKGEVRRENIWLGGRSSQLPPALCPVFAIGSAIPAIYVVNFVRTKGEGVRGSLTVPHAALSDACDAAAPVQFGVDLPSQFAGGPGGADRFLTCRQYTADLESDKSRDKVFGTSFYGSSCVPITARMQSTPQTARHGHIEGHVEFSRE
eukprot:1196311-Prorocentrum_minimum.AAC.2